MYRAVDEQGNTLGFLLTAQDALAAKRFFPKTLKSFYNQTHKLLLWIRILLN
ncbi:hypothetical protein [Chlorogloea sp. CCALA 695]|uniref:hypothetical protein n=1 Tax=Chlorogloea sp. CCALA 695 TaxID=2107693 RepID=UPI00130485AB